MKVCKVFAMCKLDLDLFENCVETSYTETDHTIIRKTKVIWGSLYKSVGKLIEKKDKQASWGKVKELALIADRVFSPEMKSNINQKLLVWFISLYS